MMHSFQYCKFKMSKNITAASNRLRDVALNRDGIQNRLGLIPLKNIHK